MRATARSRNGYAQYCQRRAMVRVLRTLPTADLDALHRCMAGDGAGSYPAAMSTQRALMRARVALMHGAEVRRRPSTPHSLPPRRDNHRRSPRRPRAAATRSAARSGDSGGDPPAHPGSARQARQGRR